MKATIITLCMGIWILQAAAQQKIPIPKWVISPAVSDYIGISPAEAPKEISVLSAMLTYLVSNDIDCKYSIDSYSSGTENFNKNETNKKFIYQDVIDYDIKKQETLKSGECVTAISHGNTHQASISLYAEESYTIEKDSSTGSKLKDFMLRFSIQAIVGKQNAAQWTYTIDQDHPYGKNLYIDLSKKWDSSEAKKFDYVCREMPHSNIVCYFGTDASDKGGLANAWNRMLCDILLNIFPLNQDSNHDASVSYSTSANIKENISKIYNEQMRRQKTSILGLFHDTTLNGSEGVFFLQTISPWAATQ